MSTKEQRRQKKLAKKRSKQVTQRKQLAREQDSLRSLAGQIKAASGCAVEHCMISDAALDPTHRLGSVLISRWMPDRRLACVRYLIDGMCLGVKDVYAFTCYPADMSQFLEKAGDVETLRSVPPARARKLVESVVAYAEQFDLRPPPEYQKVAPIWGEIDAGDCSEEFQFGDDEGKPNYISGPNDSPFFQSRVIETLERTAGKGNFNFTFLGKFAHDDEFDVLDDPELDVDIDEDVVADEYLIDR